jgi:hypothetical protein
LLGRAPQPLVARTKGEAGKTRETSKSIISMAAKTKKHPIAHEHSSEANEEVCKSINKPMSILPSKTRKYQKTNEHSSKSEEFVFL